MTLQLRWPCIGVLACTACGPSLGVDVDDASESTGAFASSTSESDVDSSSDTRDVPPSAEDSSGPEASTSETGEPTDSLRCLALVGLPVAPGESIQGFADLDADGMRELVVADDEGTVSIFAADASPGPWTLRQSLDSVDHVHDIGDIDGDGRDDLIVGSIDGANWWRAGADGTLTVEAPLGGGWLEDRRVLLPDGAGGAADVAEIVDGELVIARGLGDGTFVSASVMGAPDPEVSLFEPIVRPRDGVLAPTRWQLDCVGACTDGSHVVTVDDDFVATAQYAVDATIVDVSLVDDDAALDAFTLSNGAFELHVDGSETTRLADDVAAAQVGDFDGDGFVDLALLAADAGVVRWGEGASWSAPEPLPSAAPDGIVTPERVVDLDGDGRDELVVSEAGRHALVFAEPCSE